MFVPIFYDGGCGDINVLEIYLETILAIYTNCPNLLNPALTVTTKKT
jgi:hypothetical protein